MPGVRVRLLLLAITGALAVGVAGIVVAQGGPRERAPAGGESPPRLVKGTPRELARMLGGPVVWAGPRFAGMPLTRSELIEPAPGPSFPKGETWASVGLLYTDNDFNPEDPDATTLDIQTAAPDSALEQDWRSFMGPSRGPGWLLAPAHGRWRAWVDTDHFAVNVEIGGVLAMVTVGIEGFEFTDRELVPLLDQLRVVSP